MRFGDERFRFWAPVLFLALIAVYTTQRLVRAHLYPEVSAPNYVFKRELVAPRGSIYASGGVGYPFAKSVPYWDYSLDPVALTNAVVRPKGEKSPRKKEAIVRTIADALSLPYQDVMEMANAPRRRGYRSQPLGRSSNLDVYRTLADSKLVAGVAIRDCQVRRYLHGRHLSHVLGSVNAEYVGSAGLELRFNSALTGTPGTIQGMRDARGRELYDKRTVSIDPIPGADIFLTVDHNVQFEVEGALEWGLAEYGAGSGWCIVMDSRTGAILAMASLPDYDPLKFGTATDSQKLNRAVAFNYEPGSVMKVITASAAIDSNPRRYGPNSVFSTNRDDPNYYRLPGDGSHVWEPTMTLKHAIVHSSNIVIGKLAFDLRPPCLYEYMKKFGFGDKTGIELPGEQYGILPNPNKRMWDKASWSRAGIGQFVAVTGIQLAGAYQAIANDGVRMKPHLVSRVVYADGKETVTKPVEVARPISPRTARVMREMMLDVASNEGTARRAALPGYSVAGKTGTAQKSIPGGRGYAPGLYRASFCGIVPASDPRLVILVTLDFDKKTLYHQGGNSAGPVFKRIAQMALRYLMIPPDRPEELEGVEEDAFDKIVEERVKKYGIMSAN